MMESSNFVCLSSIRSHPPLILIHIFSILHPPTSNLLYPTRIYIFNSSSSTLSQKYGILDYSFFQVLTCGIIHQTQLHKNKFFDQHLQPYASTPFSVPFLALELSTSMSFVSSITSSSISSSSRSSSQLLSSSSTSTV